MLHSNGHIKAQNPVKHPRSSLACAHPNTKSACDSDYSASLTSTPCSSLSRTRQSIRRPRKDSIARTHTAGEGALVVIVVIAGGDNSTSSGRVNGRTIKA